MIDVPRVKVTFYYYNYFSYSKLKLSFSSVFTNGQMCAVRRCVENEFLRLAALSRRLTLLVTKKKK